MPMGGIFNGLTRINGSESKVSASSGQQAWKGVGVSVGVGGRLVEVGVGINVGVIAGVSVGDEIDVDEGKIGVTPSL